jgi:hypothetical protein
MEKRGLHTFTFFLSLLIIVLAFNFCFQTFWMRSMEGYFYIFFTLIKQFYSYE